MAAAARKQSGSEIENLVATLAGRQNDGPKSTRQLTGPERAGVLMLALGEQHGAKIWNLLDDDDLRHLSIVMSTLGTVDSHMVLPLRINAFGVLFFASGLLVLRSLLASRRRAAELAPPPGMLAAEVV